MSVQPFSYKQTREGLAGLKEKEPALKALADLYLGLLELQENAEKAFNPDLTGIDEKKCREKNAKEFPCLSKDDIQLDWPAYTGLVEDITGLVRDMAPDEDKDGLWEIELPSGPDGQKQLLSAFLEDRTQLPKLAMDLGADTGKFAFITGQALVPFMEKYAGPLRKEVDFTKWVKGYCPICGSEPLMGRLAEETGKKYLTCYLCRTDWPHGRLECPFCDNTNQRSLRYFADEDDREGVHRVDVCDQCKSYLKVVDHRKAGNLISVIADNLATLALDAKAKKEGFHRDTNRLFGL